MKALVLGMGNTLLSDDGIGIIIERYLEQELSGVREIDFVETSWGGFRIIDILSGYDYAVIADSIKTANKPQGHIYHLKVNDFLPTLRLTSYHDINFATALELAETLGIKIPKDIDIFAVEVENNYTISEQIDPVLWKSIKKCSEKIIKQLAFRHVLQKRNINLELPDIKSIDDLHHYYKTECSETTSTKLYH
jgi:hydrogenase maturation protease